MQHLAPFFFLPSVRPAALDFSHSALFFIWIRIFIVKFLWPPSPSFFSLVFLLLSSRVALIFGISDCIKSHTTRIYIKGWLRHSQILGWAFCASCAFINQAGGSRAAELVERLKMVCMAHLFELDRGNRRHNEGENHLQRAKDFFRCLSLRLRRIRRLFIAPRYTQRLPFPRIISYILQALSEHSVAAVDNLVRVSWGFISWLAAGREGNPLQQKFIRVNDKQQQTIRML